jgi:hypothetical protein
MILFQLGLITFGIAAGLFAVANLKWTPMTDAQRSSALHGFAAGFAIWISLALIAMSNAWSFIPAVVAMYLPPMWYLYGSRVGRA